MDENETHILSDPSDALSRIRSAYKRWTESDPHSSEEWYAATDALNQWDELDRHLKAGGDLPADWDIAPESTPGLREVVVGLVREGKKIHAIKEVRAATGLSLREAKDYVDSIAL